MATLLVAAKWLRNTVCGQSSPLPESAQLQAIGLGPAALHELAKTVARGLAEVSSLLEHAAACVQTEQRFPVASWGR